MWMVLLACADALEDSAPPDSPGVDSAPPERLWPPLALFPRWESAEAEVSTGLAFADLDGDGAAELVVSNGNDITPGPLRVYAGAPGALSEQAVWSSALDRYHAHLAVGDLNGDGRVDLAVARTLGDAGWSEPGGVDLYLNTPQGLPATPDRSLDGVYSFSVALGDVDGDGDLDLACAAGEGYQGIPQRARLWLNPGDGGFTDPPDWEEAEAGISYDLAFFDADSDGDLDLALARAEAPHALYRNEGGALGALPAWEAPEPGPYEGNSLDWGDLNGDGALDLVVSDNLQRGGPGSLRAWCGPDLALCWVSGDTPAHRSAVSLEDLDGDGDLDLVAGAWWGEVSVYPNDGGLSPTPSQGSGTVAVIEAFAWEDLDASHTEIRVLEGQGLGLIPGRGRALRVWGGVAGDGYISGAGPWTAEVLAPAPRDLAISHWDKDVGNQLYTRAAR